jgi:hypothetical protein
MARRLRLVVWLLYAIFFLLFGYGVFRDDRSLHYPLYYVIPAAVSYMIVTAGVVVYAFDFRPDWLMRIARTLFPVLLAFPAVGLVMDAFIPTDFSLRTNGVGWLIAAALAVVLYFPGYLAIWRLGRHGS